ncbi:MAG TPA: helix-turn-helix domain-containing protein [Bacteroidota bacterium]|nr:helix-turn-helix domain-containing protein [Bacteroidota bacterium]
MGATLISGKGYREQLVQMLLTITRRDPSLVLTDAFISDEGLNVTFADGKRAFVDFAALKRLTEHTDIRWNRVRIAPSRDHIAVELLDDKDVPVPSDILRDYIVDAGSKQRAENSVLRTTTAGTLGKRLKTLREAKKLTQEILAEKARTSRWTIMRLEKGTLLPKIAVLERIAHALGTNLLSFLPS